MKTSKLLVVLGALALLLARVGAQDAKVPQPADPLAPPGLWITEVDRDEGSGEVRLLLNLGREAGLERGDTVEVEREGKVIGHAKVYASYADMSVASVIDGAKDIARGDWVRMKSRPKRPPAASDEDPLRVVAGQNGYQVNAGIEAGLREGQQATVSRSGKPVGKVQLEQVGDKTSTLKVVEGEVAAGDRLDIVPSEHDSGRRDPGLSRDELRRIEREASTSPRNVDFVATSFLGVVAELEHPATAVLAPCHFGVLVKRVIQGSPADRAHIRPGDRVIAIDDRVVRTPVEIHRGIKRRASDYVKVTIARDDTLQVVTADFRKR